MRTRFGILGLLCAMATLATGQSNILISSFQQNGTLGWTAPTNGFHQYRIEWASQAGGPWHSFSNAAASLDSIAPTGVAMSAAVPVIYRVVAATPVHESLILVDDYASDELGADIKDVFRTPTVGPANSTAWYEGHGATDADVVEYLDGKSAKVNVPQGTALDYISHLGQACSNKAFLLTWDIVVEAMNGGGGMFFARFPHKTDGMQVLFGFLDDGRVIRFFDEPATNTFVTVATFQPMTRYRVFFIYDLAVGSFSVLFDGTWIVDREPIPGHFATNSISDIGFDLNQTMGLPGQPAQGNVYHIDNVCFGPLKGTY